MEEVTKSERIVQFPSLTISLENADRILALLAITAQERRRSEGHVAMRNAYRNNLDGVLLFDPKVESEEEFLAKYENDEQVFDALNVPTFLQFVFISPTTNLIFETVKFSLDDLPKNIERIYGRADGLNKFVELKAKLRLRSFGEVDDRLLNQLVIQGRDSNWVTTQAKTIEEQIGDDRNHFRSLLYRFARPAFWASLIFAWLAEYSLFRLQHPRFDLYSPLSGFGAIVLFAVLLTTMLGWGNLSLAAVAYYLPFIEIEGNLSKARRRGQKLIGALALALITAAFLNALNLTFSPYWKK